MAAISGSFILAVLVAAASLFAARVDGRASPLEDAFYNRGSKPQFVEEGKSYGLFGKGEPVNDVSDTNSYNPRASTESFSVSKTTSSDPSEVRSGETRTGRYSTEGRDSRRGEYKSSAEAKPTELAETNYFRHDPASSTGGRSFQPEVYTKDKERTVEASGNPVWRARSQYGPSTERSFGRVADLGSTKDSDFETPYDTQNLDGEVDPAYESKLSGSRRTGIPMERVRWSSESYHGISDNRYGRNRPYWFDPDGLGRGEAYRFNGGDVPAKTHSSDKYFKDDDWDDEEAP